MGSLTDAVNGNMEMGASARDRRRQIFYASVSQQTKTSSSGI